jgi:PhzF family phenazine biosynthesis protein
VGETIYQVDAFTDEPFAGNPAAVCVLPEPRDALWMQKVAAEMNLSETAFLVRRGDGFDLRWFTPAVEVDLCGHATLAGAHILWERNHLARSEQARFHTRSGLLTADPKEGWIEMNFPAEPEQPAPVPAGLDRALGTDRILYTGRNRFDLLVEVDSEDTVRRLQPDFTLLGTIDARGVIATSLPGPGDYDFVSRFFAPRVGVNEDPVTGSSHCCLGPYWKKRLGKTAFVARQVSARGGVIRVRIDGDRVRLGGQAVTVMVGSLSDRSS